MNDLGSEQEKWYHYRLCFTDTSFFYALVDRRDAFHEVCKKLLQQAEKQQKRILTTNFIVAEAHALILSRLGRSIAYQWLETVMEYAWIERVMEDGLMVVVPKRADNWLEIAVAGSNFTLGAQKSKHLLG